MDAEFQKLKEYLDAPKTGKINLDRYKEVVDSYEIIKGIIRSVDPDATIEIKECPLQLGSVFIKIVTSDVTVYDMDAFADATRNANNFQIYPRTDETVQFDILFEGVIDYTLL